MLEPVPLLVVLGQPVLRVGQAKPGRTETLELPAQTELQEHRLAPVDQVELHPLIGLVKMEQLELEAQWVLLARQDLVLLLAIQAELRLPIGQEDLELQEMLELQETQEPPEQVPLLVMLAELHLPTGQERMAHLEERVELQPLHLS